MGGDLRILTANLYNGGADPGAFAELIEASGADVVAVQELAPEQAEALAGSLPYGELEPRTDHCGMGIALRRPATMERIPLVVRDARLATLDPADWPQLPRPLEVVNVHVSSPESRPYRLQPGRRRRQLRGILTHLDAEPDRTRVMVGDFNATPLWPVYRRVAARLDDLALLHARQRGARPERTWPSWIDRPGWLARRRLLRIDHCFGRGLRAEDVQVLHVPGSDHCALLVDLSVV